MESISSFASTSLGYVASAHLQPLYVVKIGSSSLKRQQVFADIAAIASRGCRLLVVAGGADGIAEHYRMLRRPMPMLRLSEGREVRYANVDEMPHIVRAYNAIILPRTVEGLRSHGLRVYATTCFQSRLVTARQIPPLRATIRGRSMIVRDHLAGNICAVDVESVNAMLNAFQAVVISPPVSDLEGLGALNVDADVLAAEMANHLEADHLRLVTSTRGVLPDLSSPDVAATDLGPGEGYRYACGRMRQKVRAAELALEGPSDVAICGPHSLSVATRFWRIAHPQPDVELLARAVEISSVSTDEHELAQYLYDWASRSGLSAQIDTVGNLIVTKGAGPFRLLMMGHLDTVPHRWPPSWDNGCVHGRGSVDAKGSLVAFLNALAMIEVPEGMQVQVVGAVEEENTSEGAFKFACNTRPPDAVIIGEPSGAHALTVAYHGLVKLQLTTVGRAGHTAGQGVTTAADALVEAIMTVRQTVAQMSPRSLTATLGTEARNRFDRQQGAAIVDVRIAPGTTPESVISAVEASLPDGVNLKVLRATPPVTTARSCGLVRAFSRAFRGAGISPRFLAKKGSSDMNTLASRWSAEIPMVAYGPGDSSLDHTSAECLDAQEFLDSVAVVTQAVRLWLDSVTDLTKPTIESDNVITNSGGSD